MLKYLFVMFTDKMKDLTVSWVPTRYEVDEVEGIPLTKKMCDRWNKTWAFQAKPDDLLIATYAKAGKCVNIQSSWDDTLNSPGMENEASL